MKYIVYTDAAASVPKDISGCSYLILTDSLYIHSDSIRVRGLTNPKQAETISIGLAAAHLIDNVKLEAGDTVEFNVDSFSAIQFCSDALADHSSIVMCGAKQVINSIKVLRLLDDKCNINFQKVRGHKERINPNTFVDRLAKIAIRRE